LCLAVTALGWGINWPVMKVLLREWPPLSARGLAGTAAALGLALLAQLRGERLIAPRAKFGRLLIAAATNVTAWMGLGTMCMVWLSVTEGALLVYTMPIWATLFAWPILGERPTVRGLVALMLGLSGIVVLLGAHGFAIGTGKLLGAVLALGAAVLFAFGAVTSQAPLGLPPLAAVAWQVGLGCLPMIAIGLVFERPDPLALSASGWAAMAYMAVVPMGVCYLTWFAALQRLPPATAAMATLITPVVGVAAAALALGEAIGGREAFALGLTLGGIVLALQKRA
jgi:drug/metabolite transporter (DMT)-like permease